MAKVARGVVQPVSLPTSQNPEVSDEELGRLDDVTEAVRWVHCIIIMISGSAELP